MAWVVETFVLVLMLSVASSKSLGAGDGYSGKVLLVSMDGFRWDYVNKVSGLGNFTRLAKSGVTVDYVKPVFATKTSPTHYTIVTGLYEENHGIVANYMYDPDRNATFSRRSTESFWFDGGEPVWVTAVRQGKKTAVLFWIGSDIEIRGYRPHFYRPYDKNMPFPDRVELGFSWFLNNSMDFVALYFHEPDSTGHTYGPDSREVAEKVREMDSVLGLILDGLDRDELSDVNLILTSDHGMASIDMQTRVIDLWSAIGDRTMVERVADSGTVTAILPAEGREDELVTALKTIGHVTVYRKEDIPEHFHYTHNPRIMPVIILADEGWYVSKDVADDQEWDGKGDHGYDNSLPSMRPIFYARGPSFREGVKSTSILEVDIYPLICELLEIQAAPNNGSLDNTRMFLKGTDTSSVPYTTFSWIVLLVCYVLYHTFA